MIETIGPWVGGFVFVFLFVGGCWQFRYEKKMWNNGICYKNQTKWRLVDQDSQGGRLYRAGESTFWISWPVDRNYREIS